MADELSFPIAHLPERTPDLHRTDAGWSYQNPFTRVRARIEGERLLVPLPGATFQALELAERLQLPAAFLAAFREANRRASATSDAPRLDAAKGEAWWRWTRARPALRHAWPAADIFIPDILLLRRKDTNEVVRVMAWPDDESSALVPAAVDLVVIRPRAALEVRVAPPGLASLDATLELLGERARRFEEPVPYWRFSGGEDHRPIVAALWKRADVKTSELAATAPDRVIDAVV